MIDRRSNSEYQERVTYVLHQRSLVLESVTLAQVVKLVVKVLVDLARITIFDQQSPENAKSTHPENLAKLIFQHSGCSSNAPHG